LRFSTDPEVSAENLYPFAAIVRVHDGVLEEEYAVSPQLWW